MPWKSAYVPPEWRKAQICSPRVAVEWRVRTNRGVSLLHVPYAMLLDKKVRGNQIEDF